MDSRFWLQDHGLPFSGSVAAAASDRERWKLRPFEMNQREAFFGRES
jgi:hypothetical protein